MDGISSRPATSPSQKTPADAAIAADQRRPDDRGNADEQRQRRGDPDQQVNRAAGPIGDQHDAAARGPENREGDGEKPHLELADTHEGSLASRRRTATAGAVTRLRTGHPPLPGRRALIRTHECWTASTTDPVTRRGSCPKTAEPTVPVRDRTQKRARTMAGQADRSSTGQTGPHGPATRRWAPAVQRRPTRAHPATRSRSAWLPSRSLETENAIAESPAHDPARYPAAHAPDPGCVPAVDHQRLLRTRMPPA